MNGALRALTPREASIFACFIDAVVAPAPKLPAVPDTDAVAYFDDWMVRSPRANRIGMRAILYLIEVAPLATGHRQRLRRLDRGARTDWIEAVQRARNPHLRLIWKLVKGAAQLAYYGDDRVMRMVGYDADANVRRGRELRASEGRP